MSSTNGRTNRVINEEELFFLKLLENTDTDTDSSCCSSITNSEDDHERLYETMRTLRRFEQTPSPSPSLINNNNNFINNNNNTMIIPRDSMISRESRESRELLQQRFLDRHVMQRTRSEPTYFSSASSTSSSSSTSSIMRSSKEGGLAGMKHVRWADALTDVHTFMSPRSHLLWKKLRKKMAKAAEALKQDIQF